MHDGLVELTWKSGHISGSSAAYVEELYEEFLMDPLLISEQWREYFESLSAPNRDDHSDVSHAQIKKHFKALGKASRYARVPSNEGIVNSEHETKQVEVLLLISSYRVRGHQKAKLDPLGLMHRERVLDLELEFYNLSPVDYSTIFQTGSLFISKGKASLEEIIDILERIYCGSVGYEFMHIVNLEEKQWIQERIESNDGYPVFGKDVKRHLLERLSAAEGLEKHLDSKYPGSRRLMKLYNEPAHMVSRK